MLWLSAARSLVDSIADVFSYFPVFGLRLDVLTIFNVLSLSYMLRLVLHKYMLFVLIPSVPVPDALCARLSFTFLVFAIYCTINAIVERYRFGHPISEIA